MAPRARLACGEGHDSPTLDAGTRRAGDAEGHHDYGQFRVATMFGWLVPLVEAFSDRCAEADGQRVPLRRSIRVEPGDPVGTIR